MVAEGLAADPVLVAVAGPVHAAVAAGGLAPTAAADLVLAQSLVPNPGTDPDPGLVAVEPVNQKADPLHQTVCLMEGQIGKTMIRCLACFIIDNIHSFRTLYLKHISCVFRCACIIALYITL